MSFEDFFRQVCVFEFLLGGGEFFLQINIYFLNLYPLLLDRLYLTRRRFSPSGLFVRLSNILP